MSLKAREMPLKSDHSYRWWKLPAAHRADITMSDGSVGSVCARDSRDLDGGGPRITSYNDQVSSETFYSSGCLFRIIRTSDNKSLGT